MKYYCDLYYMGQNSYVWRVLSYPYNTYSKFESMPKKVRDRLFVDGKYLSVRGDPEVVLPMMLGVTSSDSITYFWNGRCGHAEY